MISFSVIAELALESGENNLSQLVLQTSSSDLVQTSSADSTFSGGDNDEIVLEGTGEGIEVYM